MLYASLCSQKMCIIAFLTEPVKKRNSYKTLNDEIIHRRKEIWHRLIISGAEWWNTFSAFNFAFKIAFARCTGFPCMNCTKPGNEKDVKGELRKMFLSKQPVMM